MNDYTKWIDKKVNILLSENLYNTNGDYDELKIRQLLTFTIHLNKNAQNFFEERTHDNLLLKTLIDIILSKVDDYSNDAKIKAVEIVCKFDKITLKREKDRLKKLSALKFEPVSKQIKNIISDI